MASQQPPKHNIAVLKDEPKPEQIDPIPPEPVQDTVARGAKFGMMIGIPATIVLAIGLAFAAIYAMWPEPEIPVGGSIAVVPLAHGKEGPEMADKVTADLIALFATDPRLQVTPAADSGKLRGDSRKLAVIGQDLGVRYIVDGRLIKQGDEYTLAIQLANAEESRKVLSANYSGSEADLGKLEQQVFDEIKKGTNITPSE